MVEPLSGLVEGEMAEVVWIISEADVKRNAWPKRISVRRGPDLSVKNPARQLCIYRIRRRVVAIREEYTKEILVRRML